MKKTDSLIYVLAAALLLGANNLSAQGLSPLNLEQYQKQVLGSDPGLRSVNEQAQGTQLLEREGEALTAIQLTAQANYLKDKRPTSNPSFQGNQTDNDGLSLGLKQQTSLGIQWALTQNYSHTKIYNAALTAVPVPEYYDVYPKLELNIPLWRNFFGAETSAQQEQLESQARLRRLQAEIAQIEKNNEIAQAYNALLAQQQMVSIAQDSIARAEKILTWTRGRIARNLTDSSDIYQAQAAVAARRVELLSAQSRLTELVRHFNSLRGQTADVLAESLTENEIDLQQLRIERASAKVRKDFMLQRLQYVGSEAGFQAQREKYKPQFDISLIASSHGRDTKSSEAQSQTFKEKDYFLAVASFSMPLNQGRTSDLREGYALLKKSQRSLEQSRQLNEKLSWQNMQTQAAQLFEQINLVRELEGVQKKKADAERDKFNRGRSTTFQVLSYEQDYLNTRSQRIALELQIKQFINQLNLFE